MAIRKKTSVATSWDARKTAKIWDARKDARKTAKIWDARK